MEKRLGVVVVSRELFGAGIESICARECPSLNTCIISHCEEAERLAVAGSDVCLILIEVDVVEKSQLKYNIAKLRGQFTSAGLVLLTSSAGRNEVIEYLANGAHGVIFKDQSVKEIARAIRLVMDGGVYIPSIVNKIDLLAPALAAERRETVGVAAIGRPIVVSSVSVPEGIRLSARQAAVLQLLARGLSNKAIARELGLSEATVKVHNNAVFKALKVSNRASAVARVLSAQRTGLGERGIEAGARAV